MARLNSAGDKNLVVNASAFASCPTAKPTSRPPRHAHSRAHRYDLGAGGPFRRGVCAGSERLSRNARARVAVGTGQRTFRGLRGDQVGGPEPGGQRRVAALHDRATVSPV